MHLPREFWASVTYVTSWLTLSPVSSDEPQQVAIGPISTHNEPVQSLAPPIFKPPGGRPDGNGPGDEFECEYPSMPGWKNCSRDDSSCWLKEVNGPGRFDISTDYEKNWPIGIDRRYDIEAYDSWFNADGVNFTYAKLFTSKKPGPLFNDTWFPGPWIQA